MTRIAVWSGEKHLAERIAKAIARRDPSGKVAKRVAVEKGDGDDFDVVAGFATEDDEQDTTMYADGFADGVADEAGDFEDSEEIDDDEDADSEEEDEDDE